MFVVVVEVVVVVVVVVVSVTVECIDILSSLVSCSFV